MIGASVVAGAFISAQSRTISGLSLALENWVLAAMLSFSSGLLIIGLVLLVSTKHRSRVRPLLSDIRYGNYPLWGLIGGLFGGFFVMMQGLVAGVVGVALFSVGVVAGQAAAATTIDSLGLLGMPRRHLNLARVLGLALTMAGLIVTADLASYQFSPLVLLALLAGAGTGVQQALNGRLKQSTGSSVLATTVNFVGAPCSLPQRSWPSADLISPNSPQTHCSILAGQWGLPSSSCRSWWCSTLARSPWVSRCCSASSSARW